MQGLDSQSTKGESSQPGLFVRFVELEAKECIESFRWLGTQLLQVATVLAIANLTVVGYATTNSQAGMFLLGAVITSILLIAYRAGIRGAVPLLCRLVAIEDVAESTLNRRLETGISLVLLSLLQPNFLDEARRISELADRVEKQNAMRKLEREMFTRLTTGKGTLVLVLAILAQVALVPILVFVFGWRFL